MPSLPGKKHSEMRALLRVVGPLVLGVGLLFAVVGIGSFFAAFGSFEPPRYFWCAFVGIPLLGVGASICKFAYMGTVARYMANEVAPVGKDVVNYMAHETKDAVRGVASAFSEGLQTGNARGVTGDLCCEGCGCRNEPTAKFCKHCGNSLFAGWDCQDCGHANDVDARFCEQCGTVASSAE